MDYKYPREKYGEKQFFKPQHKSIINKIQIASYTMHVHKNFSLVRTHSPLREAMT